MSKVHPTKRTKPGKPNPEFPLFAHATGRWAKKIRGKLVYFGPWEDPDGALERYLARKDDLHAGRRPRDPAEGYTVRNLCNDFLNHKDRLVESGELSSRTQHEYREICSLIVSRFGRTRLLADIRQEDFADLRTLMAKRWGSARLGKMIQCIRSVFKFAYDSEMIQGPMRFGPGFKRPSKRVLRIERARKGPKLFNAPQIRAMIRHAHQPVRCMLLLGINCGFGNADVAQLPIQALDLAGGWVTFPRPKTGVPRRCKLWSETVASIREVLESRPDPKDPADASLVFITKFGLAWHKGIPDNPLSKEVAKLLKRLKLHRAKRLGFYVLRHVVETIGGEAKDQVALDYIMGHARDDMSAAYRERISDERIITITDFIHDWLFGRPPVT